MKNIKNNLKTFDLDELIDEATVDCYDEQECRIGFLTMLENNVQTPFEAKLKGETVTVTKIDGNDRIIKAYIKKDKTSFPVDILDLEFDQSIIGYEWIAAYKKWEH